MYIKYIIIIKSILFNVFFDTLVIKLILINLLILLILINIESN